MPITIRPATTEDIPAIVTMVNRFAAQNIMLPRTEASVQQTLADWLVAVDVTASSESGSAESASTEHGFAGTINAGTVDTAALDTAPVDAGEVEMLEKADAPGKVAGCGSLVQLTDTLVEIRSLAIHEGYQGQGIGGMLVLALVEMAREQEYEQICALTLRSSFFEHLGFDVVDRWAISPKVWQACIYCAKFHHCDEVAVLMPLVDKPVKAETKPPAWNGLLRWDSWQPLKLAYQQRPEPDGK